MADGAESLTALSFVPVTARQIWSNLPLVIAGGLVFTLACVPAGFLAFFGFVPLASVAIALIVSPAWTALIEMLTDVSLERPASLRQLPHGFSHFWPPSVRLSLLFVIPVISAWLLQPRFEREDVPLGTWIVLFIIMVGMALAWSIGLYAYPLLVAHELPVLDAIRNGAILASRHVMNSVGLVSLALLGVAAVGFVGIPLALFLPGLYGMFVVNNCRLVLTGHPGAREV